MSRRGRWVLITLVLTAVSACTGGEDPSDVSLGTLGASTTAAPVTSGGVSSTTTTVTTSPDTTTPEISTTVASTTSSVPQDPTDATEAWTTFWTSLPEPRPNGSLRGSATPEVKQQVAAYVLQPGVSDLPTEVQSNPVMSETDGVVSITDCLVSQPSLRSPDQAGLLVEGEVEQHPNGWQVTSVALPEAGTPCVPGALVSEPRDLWIRDLELELGLTDSLGEMEEIESEELFALTSDYADSIEEAGGRYQGERELHPVVSALSFDEEGRMVLTSRSCHTYSDDFGVVADGEMLTDLYDPERRRFDVGEVTLFEDGWLVTSVEGSRRPCEPGDDAIEVVGE